MLPVKLLESMKLRMPADWSVVNGSGPLVEADLHADLRARFPSAGTYITSRITSITDGLSNTLLVGERPLRIAPIQATSGAPVFFLQQTINPATLAALISRASGEVIDASQF